MLNLDFSITDWQERKKIIDNYIEENDLINKYYDSIINQNNEKTKELDLILKKMYNYILYALDKTLNNEYKMQEKHRKALEDNEKGIKSFIAPKRGHNYKEPKWTIIDDEVLEKNESRRKFFSDDIEHILNKQIYEYTNLKEKIKKIDSNLLEKNKIRKANLMSEVCCDIKVCNNYKNSINNVLISSGIYNKHDILSDYKIVYNEKNVKAILKNWNEIEMCAKNNANTYLFAIYIDFKNIFEKNILSERQLIILHKLINKDDIRNYSQEVKRVVSIITKELKDG